MPEAVLKNFIFNDLPLELDYIKAMDGLAAGTFVSMYGDEVTFATEELSDYIKNTQRVINSTKTDSGVIVGLPIDQDAHDHAGGAGWIIGLELDEARGVIRFLVNWTEIGLELIGKNIRRFFSPSVDIVNKVILGGSLTNYPASRNAKGQIMLRPIELSQSNTLKEFDMADLNDLLEAVKNLPATIQAALTAKPKEEPKADPKVEELSLDDISPALKNFLQSPEGAAELGDMAAKLAEQRVRDEKRKMHTVEFASRMVGGTKDKPFGLKVPAKRVVAVLLSLPEAQAREVEKLLEMCLDSAIDFAEHGFGEDGFIQRPQLPEAIKPLAANWVAGGGSIQEFFKINPEIGKLEDFNVAEFMKAKE